MAECLEANTGLEANTDRKDECFLLCVSSNHSTVVSAVRLNELKVHMYQLYCNFKTYFETISYLLYGGFGGPDFGRNS